MCIPPAEVSTSSAQSPAAKGCYAIGYCAVAGCILSCPLLQAAIASALSLTLLCSQLSTQHLHCSAFAP